MSSIKESNDIYSVSIHSNLANFIKEKILKEL